MRRLRGSVRSLVVALVSSLVLLSVAACGSGTSGSSAASGSSASTTASSAGKASSAGSAPSAGSASSSSSKSSTASSGGAAAFFKGKTMTMMVPSKPGGGYDAFARLVAHYIQKPLGLAHVDIVNQPAGGGLVEANELYGAKPDGLTIGDTLGDGDMLDTVFHVKGVQYTVQKFNWLGRPDNEYEVVILGPAGPGAPKGGYTSFAQLMHLKGTSKKLIVLANGVGGAPYYGLITLVRAFGIPYQLIAAYGTSHATKAALLRGDGSMTMFGYGSLRTLITSHKVTLIAQQAVSNRWSTLSKTPTVVQLAQQYKVPADKISALKGVAAILRLGHTFAAPPGVPAARLALLNKAFKEAVTNPAFVAQANKEHRYPQYASGSVVKQEIDQAMSAASIIRTLVGGS